MSQGKNLEISLLLDFYGDMLTIKQQEVIDLYYNQDLSLGEIAQLTGITRQGVRDSIKRGEGILLEFEERLGLARRFRKMREGLEEIAALSGSIRTYSERHILSQPVVEMADRIKYIAVQLNEEQQK